MDELYCKILEMCAHLEEPLTDEDATKIINTIADFLAGEKRKAEAGGV